MRSGATRVGVNLLWLVPGEVGGSEEYTVRLLAAFADESFDDVDVVLYVNRRFCDAYPELVAQFTTRVAPISGSSRPLRVLAESTWLALRSRLDHCEVVHHAGGTMPTVRAVPGILTMHDLQPLANPERFGLVKRTYIRFLAPRSVRNAKRVICLSEFVANDVVERVGIDQSRIRFVPCGVGDPGTSIDRDDGAQLLDKLQLTGRPFVLYPAITYPHKNHAVLIAAFAGLRELQPDARLVLTGGAGSNEEVVQSVISAYGVSDTVIRTGRLSESDLDVLFRAAAVMAFPSLYEGFGVPVLEAMARGCPVVASTAGALPEVLGSAGVLIDPLDTAGWTTVLDEVIGDSERRKVLVRRGFERATHFAWSTSANALHAVYREFR
jgi:glycosyltransferase involved in cell wall biosynthesis